MQTGVGTVIDGKYELTAVLGTGGMGVVFEGRNLLIMRRVAIKVLHAASAASADAVARFEQEAQAAGRIGSKHIVEVLDLGNLPNGDRYMVMEFLEGETLRDRMDRFPRAAPLQFAPLILQLLDGLGAAHAAGIFHRDLKPENVFLQRTRDGDFVKLLDFGISKFTQTNTLSMTRTGAISGTPYYMAPEHACGSKDVDHRVDIYAVGVIMYEALAGRLPFDGEEFAELLFKIALEAPPPLEALRPDLHASWVQLVQRAMARQPAARFGSAGEFQEALAALLPAATPRVSGTVVMTPGSPLSGTPGTVRNWSRSELELPRPRRRGPIMLTVGLILAALGGAGLWFFAVKRAAPVAGVTSSAPRVVAAPALPTPATPPEVVAPSPRPIEPPPSVMEEPEPGATPVTRWPLPARRTPAPSASASASAAATGPAPAPVRVPRKLRREL